MILSENGNKLISTSKDEIQKVWSLVDKNFIEDLDIQNENVTSIYEEEDGKRLFLGTNEGKIICYDKQNGLKIWEEKWFSSKVLKVFQLKDKNVIYGTNEAAIKQFDVNNGNILKSWNNDAEKKCTAVISDNKEKLFLGFEDGTMMIWEYREISDEFMYSKQIKLHSGEITEMVYSDGSLFSVGKDEYLKWYYFDENRLLKEKKFSVEITGIGEDISNGRLILGDIYGNLIEFSIDVFESTGQIDNFGKRITKIVIDKIRGNFAAGLESGEIIYYKNGIVEEN